MSSASVRAFFMLMGGAVVAPSYTPPAPLFDIRDYWLGVQIFDADAESTLDQWLVE